MSGFITEPRRRSNAKLIGRVAVVRGDLLAQRDVDAIVTTITPKLEVDGTLNAALVAMAGPQFDESMLDNIYKPRPGDTFVLPGFFLPVRNVIFVITPDWRDGFDRDDAPLLRCYRHALEMARNMGLKKIAFPPLGTGRRNAYPPDRAARLAIAGIMDRMTEDIEEARIVCPDDRTYQAFAERLAKY